MSTVLPSSIVDSPADYRGDTLHSLRLGTVPIAHKALRNAWLIKNCRLRSVVELYRDQSAGSGQIEISDVSRVLGLTAQDQADVAMVRNLALLPSYDAFSIRLLLREMGIAESVLSGITLSPDKLGDIQNLGRKFTLPLIRYVYGRDDVGSIDLPDLIALFATPDVKAAQAQISRLAAKLEIAARALPAFLENYFDTFLAIAFYQKAHQQLVPSVGRFLLSLNDLSNPRRARPDAAVRRVCDTVRGGFEFVMSMIEKRLKAAEKLADMLWANDLAIPLKSLQRRLREFQVLIGMLLAGVAAKVTAWEANFPTRDAGTPQARNELLTADIVYALEFLKDSASKGLGSVVGSLGSSENESLLQFLQAIARV